MKGKMSFSFCLGLLALGAGMAFSQSDDPVPLSPESPVKIGEFTITRMQSNGFPVYKIVDGAKKVTVVLQREPVKTWDEAQATCAELPPKGKWNLPRRNEHAILSIISWNTVLRETVLKRTEPDLLISPMWERRDTEDETNNLKGTRIITLLQGTSDKPVEEAIPFDLIKDRDQLQHYTEELQKQLTSLGSGPAASKKKQKGEIEERTLADLLKMKDSWYGNPGKDPVDLTKLAPFELEIPINGSKPTDSAKKKDNRKKDKKKGKKEPVNIPVVEKAPVTKEEGSDKNNEQNAKKIEEIRSNLELGELLLHLTNTGSAVYCLAGSLTEKQ